MFFWGYLQEITLIVIVSPQLQPDFVLKIIEGGFVQASQVAGWWWWWPSPGVQAVLNWYFAFWCSEVTDQMWIVCCLLFTTQQQYNRQPDNFFIALREVH